MMFRRGLHVKRVSYGGLFGGVGAENLVSVALDSKEDLLYYADERQGFIAEITTKGVRRRKLFFRFGKRPHAIVVDSSRR